MRRFIALLVTLAVLLPISPAVRAAGPVFTATEFDILPFNEMYIAKEGADGELLVSSETLVRAIPNLMRVWQPESQNYTLLYSSRMLTFEYGRGTAFTTSEQYTAELQTSTVGSTAVYYVPVNLVCDYFGWYYSEYATDWGRILRICVKKSEALDKSFFTIMQNKIASQYQSYITSLDTPSVSPSPDPEQSPGGSSQSTPKPTERPITSPTPSPTPDPSAFILTFEGDCGGWAEALSQSLEAEDIWAAFFLHEDSLPTSPDILRRLTALHTAALLLDSAHEDLPAALREAGKVMKGITFRQSLMFRITEGEPDGDTLAVLTIAGYQLWQRHWRWTEGATAEDMLRELDALTARTPMVLSLPISEEGLAVLDALIQRQNEGTVRLFALEPGRTPSVSGGEGG